MSRLRQKEAIQACHMVTDGDKEETIDLFRRLDENGDVSRESNVTPRSSKEYAQILWHTAKKRGWFNENTYGN